MTRRFVNTTYNVCPVKPWLSNDMLHWTRGGFGHKPAPEFDFRYDA